MLDHLPLPARDGPLGASSSPPPAEACPRATALHHLEQFRARIFPGVLRRLASWKGLRPRQDADLVADLFQDVALDAIENAEIVCALTPTERNRRWMGIAHHTHYRLHERTMRRRVAATDEEFGETPSADAACIADDELSGHLAALAEADRRLVVDLLAGACRHHGTGRLSKRGTARALGITPARLTTALGRITPDVLRASEELVASWRRRAAFSVLGLAADRMRLAGDLRIVEDGRTAPDPPRRAERVAAACQRFGFLPLQEPLASSIHEARRAADASCEDLLAICESLDPGLDALPLWSFELHALRGDAHAAARALRRCDRRRYRVERLLARARLLELRGLDAAAAALLRRGRRRHPRDTRIARSLRSLCPLPLRAGFDPRGHATPLTTTTPSGVRRAVAPSLSANDMKRRRSQTA
jgi:hypothetical protein